MSWWVKRLYFQNQIDLHKLSRFQSYDFTVVIMHISCSLRKQGIGGHVLECHWEISLGRWTFSHVNENSSDRFTFRIRTKNRRSRLTALTLVWFSWDLKYPHYCSKSVRDVDPGDVVNLHSSQHSHHGLGGYSTHSGAFVCWRPSLLFTC